MSANFWPSSTGTNATTNSMTPGMQFAGTQFSDPAASRSIYGMTSYFDGSASHGEANAGLGRVFEHAVLSPDSGLTITIPVRPWNNDWHTQYVAGAPLFGIGGLIPNPASSRNGGDPLPLPMAHTTQQTEHATVMTLPQVNAFFASINNSLYKHLNTATLPTPGASLVVPAPPKPHVGVQASKGTKHGTRRLATGHQSHPVSANLTTGPMDAEEIVTSADSLSTPTSTIANELVGTKARETIDPGSLLTPKTTKRQFTYNEAVGTPVDEIAQLKYYQSERVLSYLSTLDHTAKGSITTAIAAGKVACLKHLLECVPEYVWLTKDILPESTTSDAVYVALKKVITDSYSLFPQLGWCNSEYIEQNLKLLGVIKGVMMSESTGVVNVSVVATGTTQLLSYWPNARNFDYIGFALTRIGSMFDSGTCGSTIRDDAFVMVPWFSQVAPIAMGHEDIFKRLRATASPPHMIDTFFRRVYHKRRDSDMKSPVKAYNLGKLVRNDNNIWLDSVSGKPLQSGTHRDTHTWLLTGVSTLDGAITIGESFEASKKSPLNIHASVSIKIC